MPTLGAIELMPVRVVLVVEGCNVILWLLLGRPRLRPFPKLSAHYCDMVVLNVDSGPLAVVFYQFSAFIHVILLNDVITFVRSILKKTGDAGSVEGSSVLSLQTAAV